ncbi:MAG: SH3 domain-containing protein [Sphingopyxis sp.]|uniref:SH3 domain-containing protein n=1 Tax=Sphingopyxis sp. TaxID=1908224 RepID=UPI003D6CDB7A
MTSRHLAAIFLCLTLAGPATAQDDALPYWASISVDEARMRKGPSPDVPVIWEYRRKDLPVKVVARHETWRKIEDPDGTQGWMAARLLSRARTAIVTGDEVRPLYEAASASSAILYRAEPGVVGKISDCANGWCQLDVRGRRGWIETGHIWGD